MWATRSRSEDGGLWHTLAVDSGLTALGDDDQPVPLVPEVSQHDAIDTDVAGRVEVRREGEPLVLLDGIRLTLDQAGHLGRALVELVDKIEAAGL